MHAVVSVVQLTSTETARLAVLLGVCFLIRWVAIKEFLCAGRKAVSCNYATNDYPTALLVFFEVLTLLFLFSGVAIFWGGYAGLSAAFFLAVAPNAFLAWKLFDAFKRSCPLWFQFVRFWAGSLVVLSFLCMAFTSNVVVKGVLFLFILGLIVASVRPWWVWNPLTTRST